jgi:hypothetical protein
MPHYQPEQWQAFFLAVGGGAAALTGLLVVAMSLHLPIISRDPALRHRARSILAGLAGVFMRCSLALMGGQDGRAVAIELFVVCLIVETISLFSYAPVSRLASPPRSSLLRTLGVSGCYAVEMLGALLLFLGAGWGLQLAAIGMVANFYFVISGSWLLLIGIHQDETPGA